MDFKYLRRYYFLPTMPKKVVFEMVPVFITNMVFIEYLPQTSFLCSEVLALWFFLMTFVFGISFAFLGLAFLR